MKSIGEYFSGKIDECGKNVALGLLNGIVDGLASIGKWIYDNIFKPFIEGFKKDFGIHSPSKEMATMGGYIIDGLFNAISDGIAKIKEIFTKMLETIKKVFSKIDDWFKKKFEAAWDNIVEIFSGIGGWFSDRWSDIKGAFSAVGTWFKKIFEGAWDNIKAIFENPKEFFDEVWEGIKSCFSHVTSWFKNTFSKAWQAVKNVFSKGGEIFSGIAESISDIFKDVVNSLIDGINWVISQPFDGINWALGKMRNVEILDWEPFSWLPSIDIPEIPHLAKGTVVPANYGNFLAVLGDNKRETEVVSPLGTIKKAVAEAMAESGGSNPKEIVLYTYLYPNSSAFHREVIKIVNSDKSRRGG